MVLSSTCDFRCWIGWSSQSDYIAESEPLSTCWRALDLDLTSIFTGNHLTPQPYLTGFIVLDNSFKSSNTAIRNYTKLRIPVAPFVFFSIGKYCRYYEKQAIATADSLDEQCQAIDTESTWIFQNGNTRRLHAPVSGRALSQKIQWSVNTAMWDFEFVPKCACQNCIYMCVNMHKNRQKQKQKEEWIFHPEVHWNQPQCSSADVDVLLMVHQSTEKKNHAGI